MQMRFLAVAGAVVVSAAVAAANALSSAPPVGPLPRGPVQTVKRTPGRTFTITLPKPGIAGRSWRIARRYDSGVVREVGEGTRKSGAVWTTYRAVAPGRTSVVYALTRGEGAVAYASRTFRVIVSQASTSAGCPADLLSLPANPIGPAVTAALLADQTRNRPQVTAAAIATHDTGRGPQVKSECGSEVQARTVVVYITDRALLPSQSASQRVLFVGRTRSGYRVWKRAH
jgi:predicted secreted protein